MAQYCDLHNHSLHSDGALSPEALVDLAVARGLTAIALTDHDTLDGIDAAVRRGGERGLEVVPGIELSVVQGTSEIHLLGYFVSRPEILQPVLEEICDERETRAQRMLERLRGLGCELDYAAVLARAQGGVVGRPHVAEELVACGFATDQNDAFDRFIGRNGPAYEPKRTVTLEEGARLLRQAGAVPVVAHPGASDCQALVPGFRSAGVLGLEVWHPKHKESEVHRYERLARRYDLLATGGSDFHREWPGGILPGDMRIPLQVLERVRELARAT